MVTPTPIKTMPGYQIPSPAPVSPIPGAVNRGPANPALKVPTGKPADAMGGNVGTSMSPAAPQVQAPTQPVTAVAPPPTSAPPAANTTTFGPGHDLLATQINPNNNGVNRTQLAQNLVKDWEAQSAPQFAADQRAIGQNAAKFGRIGAGMTTNDLTGLEATHNRDRLSFQNQLASGLAGDTINDARADNNELRTERDYQTGRSDKAQQDAINQRLMEQQFGNDDFQKALQEAQFGYGGSPVDTLGQFSNALCNQGGQATAAGVDLLRKPQPIPSFGSLFPPASIGTPYNVNDPSQNIFAGTEPQAKAQVKPVTRNF